VTSLSQADVEAVAEDTEELRRRLAASGVMDPESEHEAGRFARGAAALREAVAAHKAVAAPNPPPPPGTKWTRRVPHPVLIGHAASLSQAVAAAAASALRPDRFSHGCAAAALRLAERTVRVLLAAHSAEDRGSLPGFTDTFVKRTKSANDLPAQTRGVNLIRDDLIDAVPPLHAPRPLPHPKAGGLRLRGASQMTP